ncbi:MAG: FAD-dependent oxidoreductase, partial [Clostridia bacterium]|nr:FAD-dependent oxidoreductase [Clostridia bacterium]
TIDQPLAIDEIKKFIAARELVAENRFIPLCEKDDGGMWGPDYKMAIIGAGPAGLSCAYYLRTRGYDVTVFEKEERPGGMLVYGIPNFRLEKEIIDAEINVLRRMGVEFRCAVEVGKDVTIQTLRNEGYKAFYLAIGMQGGRKAGVPGEDADGVESGIAFLRRINADSSVRLDGDVVVIGGGNVAVDVARSALRAASGKVTMLCLEGAEEMPAAKDEVAEAVEEGVEVRNGWGPKEILTENGKVTGVVFKKCTRVFDDAHRFAPQYDETDTITIPCGTVLQAIGQSAVWGGLLRGTHVELRPNGTVVHDPVTFETAEPDIFVGGDIAHGARFAIDAIAGGKLASESMHRSVHPGQDQRIARDLRQFKELNKDDIVLETFDTAKRQTPGCKPGKATETFKDLRLPLTEEQVKIEAARCLGCGATVVDLNRCIGCGLCTTRCEFDAIHLSRDLPAASDMVRCEDKMLKIAPYALKRMAKTAFGGKK